MYESWRNRVVVLGLVAGLCAGGAPVAAAELSAVELKEMEQLLSQLNFDPGAVDGVVDRRTRTAIRLYQEFAVLPVNGEPSAKLLQELRQVSRVYAEMHQAPAAEATPAETTEAPAPEPAAPEPQMAEAATAEAPLTEAPGATAPQAPPPSDAAPPQETAPAAEAAETPVPVTPAVGPPPQASPAAKVAELEASPPAAAPPSPEVEPAKTEPAKTESAQPEPKIPESDKAESGEAKSGQTQPAKVGGFSLAGMIARLKQIGDTVPPASPAQPQAAAPTVAPDRAGYERTMIWKVQNQLRRIGLDPGSPDGNARPQTTRAIETYQRARGLPVDGRVSEELLARLEAEVSPAAGTQDTSAPLDSVAPQAAAMSAAPQNGYQAFRAGYGAAQAGNYDAAIKLYEQAIGGGDLSLEHLAAALYNRANAYQYLGALDKAIEDYSAAIANRPNFPAAYYNRGFAFDLKGEQIRAIDDFRKAREQGLQRLGVRSPDLPPPLL